MTFPRYNIYNKKIIKNIFFKKISIDELINKFSNHTGLENIIPLNFARTGLFYVIKKIVSKDKNEILLSPFTIFDIVNVIISAGGKPKFIDINENNPHISKKKIEENITLNTAGVLITHYHNVNPEIEDIIDYCNVKNVKIIEDCAISLGGRYSKSFLHVGSKSDYSIFSFGVFKTISTISGGILFVKKKEEHKEILNEVNDQIEIKFFHLFLKIFNKLKFQIFLNKYLFNIIFFRLIKYSEIYGFKNLSKYLKNDPYPKKNNSIPSNYLDKTTKFQIKEIFIQLDNVKSIIKARLENAKILEDILIDNKNLILPSINKDCDTFQTYPILIKNSQKEKLYQFLLKQNFDTSKYYYRNCSSLSIFREFGKNCINSEFYSNNVITLPCYPDINKEYLIKLAKKINFFFENEFH